MVITHASTYCETHHNSILRYMHSVVWSADNGADKRGLEDSERLCTMLDSMYQLYKTSEASSAKDSCQKAHITIYKFSHPYSIAHCYPTWFKLTRNLNKQLFVLPYPLHLSHLPPAHHLLHSSPPSWPPPTDRHASDVPQPPPPAPPELALGPARPTLGPSPPPLAAPASEPLSPPATS